MFPFGMSSLGIALILTGGTFMGLTLLVLKVATNRRAVPKKLDALPPTMHAEIPQHEDAVIIIRSGGKVLSLNQKARQWFDISEKKPDLEHLARRSRPSESLLNLCASEGKATFSIDGKNIEGTSYLIPHPTENIMVVTLHTPEVYTSSTKESALTQASTLKSINKLTASTMADLALEPTLESILESIEELLPADSVEITLWNDERKMLQPYRLVGLVSLDRTIEKCGYQYEIGKGFSGHIANNHKPLLITNTSRFDGIRPTIQRAQRPFKSYLGIPLLIGNKFLGTIELTSRNENAFTENDLATLELFSDQAAIAIYNSIIYHQEQERTHELSSLANISKASQTTSNLKELFSQLLEGIPKLLKVNIAGFLLYKENGQMLEAQNPFIGIPPHVVEIYKTEIPAGSPAEKVWEKEQTIIAKESASNPNIKVLGINHVMQAAGIHSTILVPLISSGRKLGYLQIGNKETKGEFTENDKRLLEIIAGQAAPIIENATLLHQSIKRALRSEAIRRIANLASSEATKNEILKYSLLELVRLIKAEKGALLLVDESQTSLELHKTSKYKIEDDTQAKLDKIVCASNFHKTITYKTEALLITQTSTNDDIPDLYQNVIGILEASSLLVVPLITRGRGVGEILLSSSQEESFRRDDLQLSSAIAGQIANALERISLAKETDVSLRQRVDQLTALTRISQSLNSTLDLEKLLGQVFRESINLTKADCGIIFLLEDGKKHSEIHLGDNFHEDLHQLEKIVLKTGESLVVNDFQSLKDDVPQPHQGVNSSLIVPITYQNQVAGLIHLHAEASNHFDNSSLNIIEALSVQAAIALGNAQRYQHQIKQTTLLNQRVRTLSNVFKTSAELSLNQPLEQILEKIAYGIEASTTFTKVIISEYKEDDQKLYLCAGIGIPLKKLETLKEKPQKWDDFKFLMREDFKQGFSYFIPSEERPSESYSIKNFREKVQNPSNEDNQIWQPEDLLFLPLQNSSGLPLGLIQVGAPQNRLRPTLSLVETLGIFASQAALAIESHKKLSELTASAAHIAREKETKRLEAKTKRVQAGLEIISTLNHQPDRKSILKTLGEEFVKHMDMHGYLIAEPSSGGPRLITLGGKIPSQAKLIPLLGRPNPLTQSLREKEVIYNENIKDGKWEDSPLVQAIEAKGLISLPITTFTGSEASILLFTQDPSLQLSPEEIRLYELLCQQASYTIQNVKLLTETSQQLSEVNILLDFSQKISDLSSGLILQTLLESTQQLIPAAQGIMILTMDPIEEQLVPQITTGHAKTSPLLEISFSTQKGFIGEVFQSQSPKSLEVVNFAQDYELGKDNLLRYREGTGGVLPISSLAAPIRTRDKKLGLILIDNFEQESAFSKQEQALLGSLTRQTALALENVQLVQAAEQRASQLESLTKATSSITSSGLKTEELIETLLTQLERIMPYDTGVLWLHEGGQLTIRAARGFENTEELLSISIKISESKLMYEMIRTGEPLLIPNIQEDDRFPAADQKTTKAWLGAPLLTKNQILGVIAIEKHEEKFYQPVHSQMLQTFSSQAAISIENAGLYQDSVERARELDQRTQRLAMLNRFSTELSRSLNVDESFEITLQELSKLIHHSIISGILWTKENKAILHAELSQKPGWELQESQELASAPIFKHIAETKGIFTTRNIEKEEMLSPLRQFLKERETKSLLIQPLFTGSDLHGFLFIHTDHTHRFTSMERELCRILANQAAISIQNALLTKNLEERVAERTQDLKREHDRSQTLLAVLKALSASLDLDEVLHQTLTILNTALDADHSTILLTKPDEEYLYYRAAFGYTEAPPRGGRPSSLKRDEGLAGWVITHNESSLVDDITKDDRWVTSDKVSLDLRSAIVAPIAHGEDILGVISLFHNQVGKFNKYQQELVHATAKQIAVAINNTKLVNYIQEQTIELGQMLRVQKVESSRSRAILESVADGVIVTNSEREITLFNDSAENILNLDRNKVIGKTLEQFSGLFGESAQRWIETIKAWSLGRKITSEVSYSEEIILDSGAVVYVQLAPVTLQDEFLGTVSNFRDITYQAEVDRLKSEFVATVSHELRTPLTSIKGYVDILLMGAAGDISEKQNKFLSTVQENTNRLELLVDDLLDVSNLEAGRIPISIQPIQIKPVIIEAWDNIQKLVETTEKSLEFTQNLPSDLPMVNGDPKHIQTILDNLLENAARYTPENGEITLSVHTQSIYSENEIQIDVKDTGVGIPAKDHDKVFERFYRGEDPLVIATSGTGLGLSIVHQLVQMHKGRIWLESSGIPGEGTTFSFTLPIHKE